MNKLLIADDEEILRMLIEDTLENLEIDIDTAVDGNEAYQKLSSGEYDFVILDYMMPGLSGRDVLERLDPTVKSSLRILMLTAKTQKEDREALEAAGADYFMAKPFSPVELSDFVENMINGAK
ncbi:response regulator transcription factor [Jeotgalibacillus haloalkalitolerans]|uniref:Response regulator n=1 Tax=Jeotgalibacillus haloalkalitolerans TaxID=3104292 RepID=A0ABU5KR94_9BACL|nr:response regulator [Jeotgalibacillus sp. HH7-29]MDZ5713326.1 response regulator [Jeotgalibacillus sp. HH7-29]